MTVFRLLLALACSVPARAGLDDGGVLLQARLVVESEPPARQGPCRAICGRRVGRGATTWERECTKFGCSGCKQCQTTTATTTRRTTPATTTTTTVGNPRWPSQVMTCPTEPVMTTQALNKCEYFDIVNNIRGLYAQLDSACDAEHCQQADWAGCVLRIAGHDLMDFANGQGGADGCLDFHDADNAGLAECLHIGEFGRSVLDAYRNWCFKVSLADFLVIAAEAVMSISRDHVTTAEPDRARLDFRNNFKFGRTTATECAFAEGRLPNPERSCTAVNETFVQSMGLDWSAAAALMGVHTLGRAHVGNSGYDGFWSDAENSRRFNNNYYASILGKGWMEEKAVAGNANKNQWVRRDSGRDDAGKGKEMMLDTDLCLAYTQDPAGEQDLSARIGCCAWVVPSFVEPSPENGAGAVSHLENTYCGQAAPFPPGFLTQRALCCNGDATVTDCGLAAAPRGPAFEAVRRFANHEEQWLAAFQAAWSQATENGHANLSPLAECAASGPVPPSPVRPPVRPPPPATGETPLPDLQTRTPDVSEP